jgi:hypothetical protein
LLNLDLRLLGGCDTVTRGIHSRAYDLPEIPSSKLIAKCSGTTKMAGLQ